VARAAAVVREAHFVGDLEEMDDLHCGHEENDIDRAIDERADGFAQGAEVERKTPLIHGNLGERGAALDELRQELRVAGAVLLNGDAHVAQAVAVSAVENCDDLAPRGRFGRDGVRRNVQFAESGLRFYAPAGDLHLAECGQDGIAIELRFEDVHYVANAHARKEEDEIEVAGEKIPAEVETGGVGLERDLAHRGHDDRISVIGADELFDLARATRLEREDAESVEAGVRHECSGPFASANSLRRRGRRDLDAANSYCLNGLESL